MLARSDTISWKFRLIAMMIAAVTLASCSGGSLPPMARTMSYQIRVMADNQAQASGVPEKLVEAIISAESSGDQFAVSRTGAKGLMQLMPGTARRYAVSDPFDARDNLRGGCTYLHDLLARYRGDALLATAAYNAGENAVDAYHGVPPYPETQTYVKRVQAFGGF